MEATLHDTLLLVNVSAACGRGNKVKTNRTATVKITAKEITGVRMPFEFFRRNRKFFVNLLNRRHIQAFADHYIDNFGTFSSFSDIKEPAKASPQKSAGNAIILSIPPNPNPK